MTESTLRRDIGQLIWVGFQGTTLPAQAARMFRDGDAGGAILFRRNLATAPLLGTGGSLVSQAMAGEVAGGGATTREVLDIDALCELTSAIHAATGDGLPPVLIAIDQEGGRVQRVRVPATMWPPMLQFDRIDPAPAVSLAETVGRAMGDELAAVGVDVDFAPVLDVHTNPDNPIIGDRAFGTSAGDAAERGLAFARGLAASGVLGCGKHFPGHGDTSTDSHLALPRLSHDMERLRQVELVPFAKAADAELPMLMTAHVVFDALDRAVPATLSKRVITELLKGELGYRGVVVSDDLDMKAISDNFGVGDAAVRAIMAGCDVLLLCCDENNQHHVREALTRAGTDRPEVAARIAEAAAAVRSMKATHDPLTADASRARTILGSADHIDLADRLRTA